MSEQTVEGLIRAHNREQWECEAGPGMRTYFCIPCDREVTDRHIHIAKFEVVDGVAYDRGPGPFIGPAGVPWDTPTTGDDDGSE